MLAPVRLALGFLTTGQRVRYFVLVALRALTGVLDVIGIGLIGFIAGVGASQLGSGGTPVRILGFQLPRLSQLDLVLLVVGVLLAFILKALIALVVIRATTVFVARIETENAQHIADMMLNGSLDSVKRYSVATLQYAVTASTTAAFTGILNNVATIVAEGFLLVIVIASFFVVNPIAAVFTLLYFGVVIVLIQFVIGGSVRRAGRTQAESSVATTNAINDSLHSFREVSVFGKQQYFLARFRAARTQLSRTAAVFAFLGGMPRYVVETSLMLGVVIFVGQQFLTGQLATGIVTIGVFLTGGVRIMASLLPLQAAFTQVKQNQYAGEIAADLLHQARSLPAPAPLPAGVTSVPRDQPLAVHVRDVRYRYPDDESGADVLRGVSIDIAAGSHVAIIGPSGAGKTTLVDLMLGLVLPDSGSVGIGGLEPNLLRRLEPGLISYVPQKPGLVSGTIAENVALGIDRADLDEDLLQRSLAAAHLEDFVSQLPEGAHTSVGNQTDALSGGQIQRIGLARALYAQPRLLILDEATSALDAGSEAYIAEGLRELHGDVTVVIIAHRLSTVQHSDVVHVVQEGQITASGKFNQLRRDVPMVAEYVKLMSFDDV